MVVWPVLTTAWTRWISTCLTPCVCVGLRADAVAKRYRPWPKGLRADSLPWFDSPLVQGASRLRYTDKAQVAATGPYWPKGARNKKNVSALACAAIALPHFGQGFARQSAHVHSGMTLHGTYGRLAVPDHNFGKTDKHTLDTMCLRWLALQLLCRTLDKALHVKTHLEECTTRYLGFKCFLFPCTEFIQK